VVLIPPNVRRPKVGERFEYEDDGNVFVLTLERWLTRPRNYFVRLADRGRRDAGALAVLEDVVPLDDDDPIPEEPRLPFADTSIPDACMSDDQEGT